MTFPEELAEAAFTWTQKHCDYVAEKTLRDMCESGRSQTYNTALEFSRWTLTSSVVRSLYDAVTHDHAPVEGEKYPYANCSACIATKAFDAAVAGGKEG